MTSKMMKYRKTYTLCLLAALILFPISGHAQVPKNTVYRPCNVDNKPPACNIAFAKLQSMKNPLKPHNFFHSGLHIVEGKIFAYPDFFIAETDIDGDGFNEIIVKIPDFDELMTGHYCKADNQCVHYIFQDRNISTDKPSLRNIRAFGPYYVYSIGLSTNEVFGGYRSLRMYKDDSWKKYDVYQYDKKTDDYYNVTAFE